MALEKIEYEWQHDYKNGQCDAFDCSHEDGPIIASINFDGSRYKLESYHYEYECPFYARNRSDAREIAEILLDKMYEVMDSKQDLLT